MMTFAGTRRLGLACIIGLSLGLLNFYNEFRFSLKDATLATGIGLFFIIVILVSFNIRKKFPYLPLGKVSRWLKVHIYLAWFSIVVFFVHIEFRFPDGGLELLVGCLFCLAAFSGVVGAWLSKIIPRRLTDNGGAIVYETISIKRRAVRAKAEELILRSIKETKKNTLADFYAYRLSDFFIGTWNYSSHLMNSNYLLKKFHSECEDLKRYLSTEEIEIIEELKLLIAEKNTLDEHYTLLNIMKYWLFIHVPLSYSLLVFGALHGILALKMSGLM
ncbi:MAG: hypothetical protein HN509_07790 [Halobacteriovoraceae bacterium]|jgi:hypothetical protein|nr:hypothetical protein [Halobacteriovoraceae bacterium]MBT5093951.1 hypothetical protein [Halobacteriovoraceae bacterium]